MDGLDGASFLDAAGASTPTKLPLLSKPKVISSGAFVEARHYLTNDPIKHFKEGTDLVETSFALPLKKFFFIEGVYLQTLEGDPIHWSVRIGVNSPKSFGFNHVYFRILKTHKF